MLGLSGGVAGLSQLPAKWVTPVVNHVILPGHAASSTTSTGAPTTSSTTTTTTTPCAFEFDYCLAYDSGGVVHPDDGAPRVDTQLEEFEAGFTPCAPDTGTVVTVDIVINGTPSGQFSDSTDGSSSISISGPFSTAMASQTVTLIFSTPGVTDCDFDITW